MACRVKTRSRELFQNGNHRLHGETLRRRFSSRGRRGYDLDGSRIVRAEACLY